MSNDLRFRAMMEDRVSGTLDKISSKMDKVAGPGAGAVFTGTAATKALTAIADGAYKAGAAVVDFLGDSVAAASDLNETISKTNVVFGDNADAVEAWGNGSAKAMGLSKQAALEAASTLGNLFTNLDETKGKAVEMSEGVVQLAGDLASFNNIDPTEALQKLRSGLSGEAEPLRSVGVFLTEAKVKAKAMELGLGDAHGELTEGAKVAARYALILDETKTAQGDFARTADQLANSQRTANAEMLNAQAALGQKLLPVQLQVTRTQIDFFTGLNALADAIGGKVTPEVLAMNKALGAGRDAFRETREHLADLDQATVEAGVNLGFWTRAEADAAGKSREAAEATHYMATHVKDDSAAAALAFQGLDTGATTAAGGVEVATGRMIDAADKLKHKYLTDTETIVHDAFDRLITSDNLAATNSEIAAQRRIIASSTATAAEKRDATARLHQLQSDQLGYLEQLAEGGASGTKTFTDTMKKLNKELANSHGEEAERIREEIRLINLLSAKAALAKIFDKGSGYSTFGGGNRATGGPIWPGEWTVGEHGPEHLTLSPSGHGFVTPLDAPAAAAGGGGGDTAPHVTQVFLDGRLIAEVVDEYQERMVRRAPAWAGPA